MLKKVRKSLAVIAAVIALAVVPMVAVGNATVSAQDIDRNLKCGANLDVNQTDCTVDGGTTKINTIITNVINIFSLVVGIVSVIMIIYGGFRYVTSGGDSGNVSSAKNTIIYAVIGLVVVALAQFIVQFVLNKVSGTA
jgi:hypothetical protein